MTASGFLLAIPSLRPEEARNQLAFAAQPIADGVPAVAVVRLQALLEKTLPEEEWRGVAEKLIEAFLAAGQSQDALSLMGDARLRNSKSMAFWRAQAFAGLRRWNEALGFYRMVAADRGSPFQAAAIFGAAEMLRALERTDEALQTLSPLMQDKRWNVRARLRAAEMLLDKADPAGARRMLDEMNPPANADKKERRFLKARVELAQGRPERAIGIFQSVIRRPEDTSHSLALATLFRIADSYLQLGTPETGDDFLEDFITRHPHDADLALLFQKLDTLYRAEKKPTRTELEQWTREPDEPRRAFAQWYLARMELRAGHRERATQLFTALRKSAGNAPAAPGLLEFAKLELEDGHFDEALAILEDARSLHPEASVLAKADLMFAETQYHEKQFEPATIKFEQIARSASPAARISMFNASLGRLQLGDHAGFLVDYGEFEKQGGSEESRAELRLEEGLMQAGRGDKTAPDSLKKFVRDFSRNPRVSEAWVALAELAFHARPPRLDEAKSNLARAAESKPTAAAIERSAYLKLWIEDSGGASDSVLIDLANQFLKEHPGAVFAADVRMKLAEIYYRRQDFANAQTHFEILAQENPSGPLAEKALFFAAESAMSSMSPHALDRAIELFDRVVQLKGDLKWAARNEQAVIERKLGKPQDALLLYDEVLRNEARPSDKREALCGRGDIFFDQASEDPKNYERAIEAYERLASEAGEPGHWRNQALFKKGICLEKEAKRDGALETFYRVLESQTRPDRVPEFFWFYKAGFNAARLLEDASNWSAAAAVYEKLVAAGGTRSDEAKARLDRLRLEHFLWQN